MILVEVGRLDEVQLSQAGQVPGKFILNQHVKFMDSHICFECIYRIEEDPNSLIKINYLICKFFVYLISKFFTIYR